MIRRVDPRWRRYREASVNIVGKYATDGESSLGATNGVTTLSSARMNVAIIPNAGGLWSVNIFRGAEWGAGSVSAQVVFTTSGASTNAIPVTLTMRQLVYGSATVLSTGSTSLSLIPTGAARVPVALDAGTTPVFSEEYDLLATHLFRSGGDSNPDDLYLIGVVYEYIESS